MLMSSFTCLAGSFEWAKHVSHANRGYYSNAMKADKDNNLIIGGQGNFCLVCPEGFISKYDSLGNEVLYITFGQYSNVESVGVDFIGNIYFAVNFPSGLQVVLGLDTISNNSVDNLTAIIKLNPQGILQWWKPWVGNNSLKMAVDSIGNAFVSNGDTLRRYNSNGVFNWSVPVLGSVLDVESNYLVVATSTSIQRIAKSNGSISSTINVSSCRDLALDRNGEIYFTGNSGTGKIVGTSVVWNNSLLNGHAIDCKNNSIWLVKNSAPVSGILDSSIFYQLNTAGLVLLSDTTFNSIINLLTIDNSNKVFFTSDWVNPDLASSFPPYFVYRVWTYFNTGFVLGRYDKQSIPKLAFNSVFWDPNNYLPYDGNWKGLKKCPGSVFNVDYKLYDAAFAPGSIVFVELSNELGSFSNPTIIGAAGASSITGVVSCQLPTNLVNGLGYVIRLKSNIPNILGSQNSCSLGINAVNSLISLSSTNTTFCSKSETLSVNVGEIPQWLLNGLNINGATSGSYKPTVSGTYSCNITDVYGCSRVSTNQIAVNVLALPGAAITPSVSTEMCIGDSVIVSVPLKPNYTYQWYKSSTVLAGQTSNIYNAKSAGNYKVVVTGSNGCTKTSLASKLTVYRPTINAFGPTTFCLGGSVVLGASNGSSTAWQWRKNNIDIVNETNQFFVANSAGDYKVFTTSSGGCSSVSAKVSVVVNCRDGNYRSSVFEVYPNPSVDFINISGSVIENEGLFSIYDLTGRVVESFVSNGNGIKLEVEISGLQSGMYIVSFIIANGEKTFSQFIKEN